MKSVLFNELRLRMRPTSTSTAMVLIVLLTACFALAAYTVIGAAVRPSIRPSTFGIGSVTQEQPAFLATIAGQPGVSLYVAIALFDMLVLCLAAGLQGATSIVGEKERQTFDLLWTTSLRPASLLAGKFLVTTLSNMLLMIVVAPVYSIVLVYQGVPWDAVLSGCLLMICALAASASAGLLCSALAPSILSATVTAAIAIFVGFLGGAAVYVGAQSAGLGTQWQGALFFSPSAALVSTVVNDYHTPLALLLPGVLRASPAHPAHLIGHLQNAFPLWTITSVLLVVVTILLLAMATATITLAGRGAEPAVRSRRSARLHVGGQRA